MVGLYNGLEMATAILENREPEFLDLVKEPPVIENEEEQTGEQKGENADGSHQ